MRQNDDISNLLLNLFENLPLSIAVLNSELEIEYVNCNFEIFFKTHKKIGNLHSIFVESEVLAINKLIKQTLESGNAQESDIRIKRGENEEYLLNTQVNRFTVAREFKIAVVFKDVSERRHNQELAANREALDKVNVELDQFVYKTAHDLRAPLTNLIGLIGLMRNELDLEVLNTYFDLQETSVKRMDDFIQKITTYTKNTRLPIRRSKIDFKSLIDSVLNGLMFYDKSASVRKNVTIEDNLHFFSDYDRLEIILKNLLANAIKFSSNNTVSELTLSVKKTETGCKIELYDNGIGIPESIQNKVFGMFYRGHASADGSGIGLYIVKETLAKLGGTIVLESKENEFTKITLNLPSILSE